MVKQILKFFSICTIVLSYGYMYFNDQALAVYGVKKPNGRDCLFIDSKVNVHDYYVPERLGGYGIHGCPVFTPVR